MPRKSDMGDKTPERSLEPFEAEALRRARADRRLVEFELVERKVLLGSTVLFLFLTAIGAFVGGPALAVAPGVGSALSACALLLRSRSR
jgi:hypothetical protein